MRTKLAAIITAAAVTLTPVSVATAHANPVEELSSAVQGADLSSKVDIEGFSSKLKVDDLSSTVRGGELSSDAKDEAENNPGHAALLDVVVAVGLWALLGSMYGSVIAPNLPDFNLYDIAPFLRG